MALKKSPLNADPDPACFFTHRTCINMPSTAPERRQSPQERSGEGEGGGREERETRQSPGWLFLALLIVWDFFPASFATPRHYCLHTGSKICGGCPVGLVFPGLSCKRRTSEEGETARTEGPGQERREGMMCRKQRQRRTKLSSCTGMKIQNGNSGLEGRKEKSGLEP